MSSNWRKWLDPTSDKIFALLGRLILAFAVLVLFGLIVRFIFSLPGISYDPILILISLALTYQIYVLRRHQEDTARTLKDMKKDLSKLVILQDTQAARKITKYSKNK